MYTVIGRFAPQAFALMRIVIGVLFALHGVQILFGFPPMKGMGGGPMPPIVLAAGIIELIGGLLVAIGLITGIAAFICSGTMAVAYWTAHAPHGWHPIANQGELAAVYCFIFLYIAAHGGGVWSVDAAIRGRSPVTAPSPS
jgi:putative oxidoreductase